MIKVDKTATIFYGTVVFRDKRLECCADDKWVDIFNRHQAQVLLECSNDTTRSMENFRVRKFRRK